MQRSLLRRSSLYTHEVINQAKPLVNFNLYSSDSALRDSLYNLCNGQDLDEQEDKLLVLGQQNGEKNMMDSANLAEKHIPRLRQFDDYGRRVDVVDYHSSYHQLMKHGIENDVVSYGFKAKGSNSHVIRAAMIYMQNQLEPGHCCPLVMTTAAIPVLQKIPQMKHIVDKIHSSIYDPDNRPISEKAGVTIGMSMTEKQGGSDVRANTTLAKPVNPESTGEGQGHLLTGHKWFTSAPMSDAFLTLAKTSTEDTPSCFLVERWLRDGTRNNGFQIIRLKDKLADRSNASSEVEYRDAYATMIGTPGKGVKTIIEMVQSTRLDCTLGSAGTNRRALQVALNHASSRSAFGSPLIEQPLMRNLLTDLCVEAEAHTSVAMRMAAAFDRYCAEFGQVNNNDNNNDNNKGGYKEQAEKEKEKERDLFRVGVSVSKYFVTKRSPGFVYECMEVLGGNGFVEDFPMAKLFRQSPLNSIWEGSGNVIALDIILRGASGLPILLHDIQRCRGNDRALDLYIDKLQKDLLSVQKDPLMAQRSARMLVDRLGVALSASSLVRFGDPMVAQAYIASRIGTSSNEGGLSLGGGVNYGGLCVYSLDQTDHILGRSMPMLQDVL